MSPLDNPRRRRQIEAIWKLGPRVFAELLVEVANLADLDIALEKYARLDGDVVRSWVRSRQIAYTKAMEKASAA